MANHAATLPDCWLASTGALWLNETRSMGDSGTGGAIAAGADCGGHADLDPPGALAPRAETNGCLLYTSDAADDTPCVDL
eukprot:8848190-Pyramimonas_sp.AAC.1